MQDSANEDASAKTIGEIVAADFRTAKVFENHGIDFCCGGKVALSTICIENGLDFAAITRELEAVKDEPSERSQNYSSWALPFLADYIVNTHHGQRKPDIRGRFDENSDNWWDSRWSVGRQSDNA